MDQEPVIRTAGLRKAYGSVVALEELTIDVPRAAVGFLGANGAGKTTLLSLLLGLRRPSAGAMTVLGRDVATEASAIRARVGYMPESDCLPRDVTAAEFVGHMAAMSGLPPEAARLRAAETLYHCGLEEERYRPIGGFSTGMKQRVKLAQALVHGPDLLFLDEPTNGLDPGGRAQMLQLIKRIYSELGITIVLSSHVLEDVYRDRVGAAELVGSADG
jgi:ABC-2 type transport system ATP-binding protein